MRDRCKDCTAEGADPKGTRKLATNVDGSLEPGPRCVTHHRARRKVVRANAHAARVDAGYGITVAEYWLIYATQGGRCAICQQATGKTKRLAVDHDHKLALEHGHDPAKGCRLCVRGLLCGRCNRWGVPLFIEAVIRAVKYLHDPPARKVLASEAEASTVLTCLVEPSESLP